MRSYLYLLFIFVIIGVLGNDLTINDMGGTTEIKGNLKALLWGKSISKGEIET